MCVCGGGGGVGVCLIKLSCVWLTRYPVFVDVCELEIV